jgi:competence protein CoiA
MQFSNIEGKRVEAFTGGRGKCPICGGPTIAKCGSRVLHHWAHLSNKNCDPWWENETEWHRNWKSLFPAECREIGYIAHDGEVHRADVVTPTGITLEFQHSAMSDAERLSREIFYQNLVWVIDGRSFRNNFHVFHALPDPISKLADDLVWFKAKYQNKGTTDGMFFRLSTTRLSYPTQEIMKGTTDIGMVQLHGIREILADVQSNYVGHHQYDWIKPRKTWLDATCPVYIDFDDEFLVMLEIYDATSLPCIRFVAKDQFLQDVMRETKARAVGINFEAYRSGMA